MVYCAPMSCVPLHLPTGAPYLLTKHGTLIFMIALHSFSGSCSSNEASTISLGEHHDEGP